METQEAMNLNLNQQPVDQPHADSVTGLDIILDELGSNQGHIEERIRQLEAVIARQRQHQRWRRQAPVSPIQIMNITSAAAETQSQLPRIQTMNTARERETDSSLLIAEALTMDSLDTTPKRVEPCSGSFFDCNICFDVATDPILTCCGHLFCWPCYYHLSYADSYSKECPECQGEVNDASIIPVYGHGDGNTSRKRNESVSAAPPRPRATRIEGVRQQFLRRGPSSMIEHRIQQLRNMVGANGERREVQGLFGSQINAMDEITSILPSRYTSPATEMSSNQHRDSLQVSGLLIQRAASASSISSALNTAMDSAERLLEDLEAYSNLPHRRRNRQQSPSNDNGVTSSYIATIIRPENLASDTAAENDPDVIPGVSFLRTFPAISGLEDQPVNSEINSTLRPSSSRRRSNLQRESDVTSNMHSSETRRRRLR